MKTRYIIFLFMLGLPSSIFLSCSSKYEVFVVGSPLPTRMWIHSRHLDLRDSLATIEGHITESDSGKSLSWAYVLLTGTRLGDESDSTGYFRIDNIPPGTYQIRAGSPMFKQGILDSIKLHERDIIILDIHLALDSGWIYWQPSNLSP